jgi:uncharacterized protein (TIGR03437 family)
MKCAIAFLLVGSAWAADLQHRAQPYLEAAVAAGDDFVCVSSASGMPNLAADSLATAFGANIGVQTAAATAPYPTSLGGVSFQVVDSAGQMRLAPLLYVSRTQINYLVPAGTAAGTATMSIVNGSGNMPKSTATIQTAAPALFTANGDGKGVVAATAYRTVIPTHITSPVQVFQCGTTPGSCVSVPIDVGVDAPVTVNLFATGLRGRSSDSAVKVTINGQDVPVSSITSVDDTDTMAGVDQVAVPLILSLRGSGEVDVVLSVDGKSSNTARINIQ